MIALERSLSNKQKPITYSGSYYTSLFKKTVVAACVCCCWFVFLLCRVIDNVKRELYFLIYPIQWGEEVGNYKNMGIFNMPIQKSKIKIIYKNACLLLKKKTHYCSIKTSIHGCRFQHLIYSKNSINMSLWDQRVLPTLRLLQDPVNIITSKMQP